MTLSDVDLDPAFDGEQLDYTSRVIFSTTQTQVTLAADDGAAVTINDREVTLEEGIGSSEVIDLAGVGVPTTITIVVESEDKTAMQTYTVVVVRDSISADATLSALTLVGEPPLHNIELSPSFATTIPAYTASVVFSIKETLVVPTANHLGAAITVNGESVASGSTSSAIALAEVALTTITIVVTAEDGETSQTYTLVVRQADKSSIATLRDLVFRNERTEMNLTLTPEPEVDGQLGFRADITTYTSSVIFSVMDVVVIPTASHSGAMVITRITVQGTPVESGDASNSIPLDEGDNTITIVVTAENGKDPTTVTTVMTYTVMITRQPLSDDTALSALILRDGI